MKTILKTIQYSTFISLRLATHIEHGRRKSRTRCYGDMRRIRVVKVNVMN